MEDDDLQDERTIELSAIAAIFPELGIDPSDPYKATLDLPVTPLKPLRIQFSQPTAENAPAQLITPPTSTEQDDDEKLSIYMKGRESEDQVETHELEHLPPLKLNLQLHDRYPADEPPKVNLTITPQWLPHAKLEELASNCVALWEEVGRDQVVYSYIDHLQQQAENAFGLAPNDHPVPMRSDIKLALLDYDLRTKRDKFEKETFDCSVCLEPKKGKDCHRLLLCGHVFCTACLKDFYNNCIREGDVDNVKCLAPDCGKDNGARVERLKKRRKQDRTLNPSELLQIPIEQDLVQRYVRLKRKKRLESDKNTIYCPRQWCQGAARSKKHPKPEGAMDDFADDTDFDSEPELEQPAKKNKKSKPEDIPMSQRLGICEDCSFAFCIVCRKGWHGEMTICNPRRQKELDEEELASLEYLKRCSTPCPTCNAPAQKTMGCNHMICFKCRTHFCYLCSAYLMPDNPYRHFNDFKSTCYMRLWALEGGDGEGDGHRFQGFGGGGGWEEELELEEEDSSDEEGEEIDLREVGEALPPRVVQAALDDTDDEEPAPDIRRRERAIEIVNFARGNQAQRIVLPEEPRPHGVVPPPAPVPPRPRGERRRRARQRNVHGVAGLQRPHQPRRHDQPQAGQNARVEPEPRPDAHHALLAEYAGAIEAVAAAPRQGEAEAEELPILPRAAPGQGNDGNAHLPAPGRAMGLERFLELAQNDREDEWDSDELDEDDDREDMRVNMGRIDGRERGVLGMRRGIGRGIGLL